jgi:Tfp pilus assembly protein PilO
MKALTPFILIAAAIGLFFGFIDPQYKKVQIVQKEQAEYRQVLDKSKELQQKRDALREKYRTMNPADLEKLKKMVPDTVDNVRLVLDIDNIASRYGIIIKNIQVAGAPGSVSAKNQKAPEIENKQFGSISLSFSATASYDVFLQFLKDLEQSQRIVDVTEFTLNAGKSENYTYDVTIQTYWLR